VVYLRKITMQSDMTWIEHDVLGGVDEEAGDRAWGKKEVRHIWPI
jgi:hypothetical protein